MNKDTIRRVIESLMSRLVGREVSVNFAHLGTDKDYTIAIQKSLFEFSEDTGPVGPMYIVLNSAHLQDASVLIQSLNQILDKYEE
tara:strand:- start:257 stop:511 length:255 start_codon:yes stop_codon:yes gene_type:complete